MSLVDLKNVEKYFFIKKGLSGSIVNAVNGVSLTINQGENLSLVGESGCGKTTLARIIIRLYMQNAGNIIFDGKNISKWNQKRLLPIRKDIQIVFQDPYSSLDPRFTVKSILNESLHLDRSRYRTDAEKEKVMAEILQAVGLNENILSRFPHEFSGGERQRIAIARALIMKPKLLILDEAVSSLDVLVQEQILELLKDLQEKLNVTYLFISHNLRVVKKISDTVAVMYKGKIVELASTEEIFQNPLHPYTKELLAAAIEYKAVERTQEIEISENAKLVDRGNDHFVIG